MNILEKSREMAEQAEEETKCLAAYIAIRLWDNNQTHDISYALSAEEVAEILKPWISECRSLGSNENVKRKLMEKSVCLEDFGLSLPTKKKQ